MFRRLIVNADDLGMNAPRSHGIFVSMEQGIVTDATLVVNGSDSERAARHAKERDIGIGLHFNITEGSSISTPEHVRTLLNSNGDFIGYPHLCRGLSEGTVDLEHLERELRSQLEWFLDHRGFPTHVDSHHHIHIHPMIVSLLIPILQRYGISKIRLPVEPLPPFGWTIEEAQLHKAQGIVAQAEAARPLYEANGMISTDSFRGLALAGNASLKNLRHILSRFPEEGTVELMVHPGSPTPIGTPFDLDPQRQTEFRMVCDPSVEAVLRERKIDLCSYADL